MVTRIRLIAALATGVGFVSLVSGVTARGASVETPTQLSEYRIVQYATTHGASPYRVIGYDNNGDVLFACRSGRTREQLAQVGAPVTDSQIRLLEVYDLLSVDGDILTTAFPILGPEQMLRIRAYAKEAAADLGTHVRTDVVEFLGLLREDGRERNAYSMLFAYIFDGMVWSEFGTRGLVKRREIDVEHPFWAGEVYAFYPPRSFSCGTNTYSEGSLALHLNWSRSASALLGPFYHAMKELDDDAFRDLMQKGHVEDDAVKDAFAPFGMFDEAGRLTIPVIDETEGNPLYQVSRRISKKLAEHTLSLISFAELTSEFGFRDVQQTLVIVFHELIWDLMDVMEAEGLVQKPVAFSKAEEATSKHVADLMFVVRGVDRD